MVKRRKQRILDRLADSITTPITDGRDSSSKTATVKVIASLEQADHAAWLVCFSAALGGAMSAHRTEPDPHTLISKAAAIADLGIAEARARRHVSPTPITK